VNQYESQEIRERLLEAGMREAAPGRKADLYIVNTCTVTRKADKDSLYAIRRSHREDPGASIVATGCMAEFGAGILRKEPGVRMVIKNRDKAKISARIIKDFLPSGKGISFFEGRTRAFLKVQDGCNNFCSYCIVPHVRGSSRSKPVLQILEESRRLIANGYREIVLTGICLGAYGRDLKRGMSLAGVIERMQELPGLKRIRISSIEAKDVDDGLIRCLRWPGKLCRHMHIPIQSGDDDILAAMDRRYTRRDYLDLIARLKKACPDIAITTDVLVGFPGEEERNFLNTLDLVRRIEPLRTHIFPYSPRPNTKAYALRKAVALDIVRDRLKRMSEAADDCARNYQQKRLSSVMDVLMETPSKDHPGEWEGYTDTYMKVVFRSRKRLSNNIISLRLKKLIGNKIMAVLP